MRDRFKGKTSKSPSLRRLGDGVAAPIPPDGIIREAMSTGSRQMPQDEAPRGIDPKKWATLNRAQRREIKRKGS